MKLEKNELVKSTRAAYGEVLQEIGEEFPDVVVMDADLSESTMTCHFAENILTGSTTWALRSRA